MYTQHEHISRVLTKQLSDLPLSKTCVAHVPDIVIEYTRIPHNVQQLREPIASDVVVSAQQSQSNCLCETEISTAHIRRASLGPVSVVAQELDGVALHAVHVIAKVALAMDL